MDQRVQFIADYQRAVFDIAELARRYGISRKTAYKWIERYEIGDRPSWSIGHGGRRIVRTGRPRRSSRPCWRCGDTIRPGVPRSC